MNKQLISKIGNMILEVEKTPANIEFLELESVHNKQCRLLVNGLRSGFLIESISRQYVLEIATHMNFKKLSEDDVQNLLTYLKNNVSQV